MVVSKVAPNFDSYFIVMIPYPHFLYYEVKFEHDIYAHFNYTCQSTSHLKYKLISACRAACPYTKLNFFS